MTTCRFALLCETATQRDDDLIDITAGALDRITTPILPSDTATLTIVFKIDFDEGAAATVNGMQIKFYGPDEAIISILEGGFLPAWDGTTTATMIVPYSFTVAAPGRHWFAIWVDNAPIAALPLDVVIE